MDTSNWNETVFACRQSFCVFINVLYFAIKNFPSIAKLAVFYVHSWKMWFKIPMKKKFCAMHPIVTMLFYIDLRINSTIIKQKQKNSRTFWHTHTWTRTTYTLHTHTHTQTALGILVESVYEYLAHKWIAIWKRSRKNTEK